MIRIALQSATHHRVSLLATSLVAFVGIALVSSMAALLSTGLASGTTTTDRPFLTQFPIILGGWILAIVLFAMVSTVAVSLDNRTDEITGLRLVGATPHQVRRLVSVEATAVAAVAAVPGIAAGYGLGWGLLTQIQGTGMVSSTSPYAPGWVLPVSGAIIVVAASAIGGWLGSRIHARRSPVAGSIPTPGAASPTRAKRIIAVSLIVAGLASSLTVLAMDATSIYSTAATGPGCVLVSVGLCLLAADIISLANRVLRMGSRGSHSTSGYLARVNLAAAPDRIRPVVTFLILFIGVAAGTLSMQGIENSVSGGSDGMATVLASINSLVVALIAAFMAIALTNNLVSTIAHRGAELKTLWLVGATTRQSQRMVSREVGVAVVLSVISASLGALVSVIPFSIVKTGSALAAAAPAPFLVAIGAGAAITLGVAWVATGRTASAAMSS